MDEFHEITTLLGTAYRNAKKFEKEKNSLRDEFFQMVDVQIGDKESFEYVNRHDGYVYSRQMNVGSPTLDDERLQKEDPQLWEDITYIPEPERTLRPLEDLTPEQLARIGDYLLKGKSVAKLAAPRKAKPEELAQ